MSDFNISVPKERKLLIISLHVFVIFCIIGFQSLLIISIGESVSLKGYLIFLLQILVFYLAQYWAIPNVFEVRTRKKFFLLISLLGFGHVLVRGLITYAGKTGIGFLNFLLSFEQVVFASLQLLVVFGLSFFMAVCIRNERLWKQYVKAVRVALEANAEKSRQESISFQMRQSPHLTFNFLNYIKVNVSSDPAKVEKAIDLYSQILRHSLIDVNEIKAIALSAEIAQVKNQLQLFELLFDGKFFVDFKEDYNNATPDLMVPPATLLTLVENIAKYGIVNSEDYPAGIAFSLHGNSFIFSTWNYKRANADHGSGLGLKSVASTLNYYYPERHTLNIEDLEDTFSLTLNIEL